MVVVCGSSLQELSSIFSNTPTWLHECIYTHINIWIYVIYMHMHTRISETWNIPFLFSHCSVMEHRSTGQAFHPDYYSQLSLGECGWVLVMQTRKGIFESAMALQVLRYSLHTMMITSKNLFLLYSLFS